MNRFIAEKVMKEWWPITDHTMPDYTTSSDYFALLQLAIKKEWFPKLLDYTFNKAFDDAEEGVESFLQSDSSRDTFYTYQVFTYLLAPENFARLVAEYHGWKGEGK